ncbi:MULTISPECIES: MucR family transcriptional regulator [unclassified Methylobacterium]|uniref:MucR family transcriptional regulator n=1 Tax=unclassified Methylobacterium TaxID=2615210 RepID=UPI0006F281AC|nr:MULTISPECIES: MucR family transcriptional regulator [unclassified Methylobacterium]KQP85405.1 MucR family transcriptional regulator [Methylobacterium sp. Leaf113]KQP96734.1 MucR family transcriptional regulator [Methylobacterium sp. Leaf117]MCK2052869.1 MucR family transcriptional regulator [Methylobacterium sp. 37f]
MSENTEIQTTDFVDLAADIVAAYVSNNPVRPSDLPDLIRNVHASLSGLAGGVAPVSEEAEIEKPSAAQIRKSVTPDGIVSFLDGKSYKTLKRHLSSHGLDPHSYRQRYGLPADYPMVAPSYAAMRSELAKSIGLGQVANRNEDEDVQPKAKGGKKAA